MYYNRSNQKNKLSFIQDGYWATKARIMHLLVVAGANKDACDNHGRTALMFASRHGHVEAVRFLVEAGADKDNLGEEINPRKGVIDPVLLQLLL